MQKQANGLKHVNSCMIYDCFRPEIKILNISMLGISFAERAYPLWDIKTGVSQFWCHKDSPIIWGIHNLYEGFPVSPSPSHCSRCHHGASLTGAPSLGADVLSQSPPWIELTEAPSLSASSPRLPDPHDYQSPEIKKLETIIWELFILMYSIFTPSAFIGSGWI